MTTRRHWWRHRWRHRWSRRPAVAAPALLLTICLVAAPARAGDAAASWGPAVDWSLTGQVRTKFAGTINRALAPGVRAGGMTVRLDARLTLAASAKQGSLAIDAGLARSFFLGADSPASDKAEQLDPHLSVRVSRRGKTWTLSGTAGFDLQPTSATQADDTGIVNDETTQITADLSASLALELDTRNRLTLGANASVIDFTSPAPGLVPTRTVGFTLAWDRQMTATTDVVLDTGLRYFTADSALATRSLTFDIGAGLTHRRTQRHIFGLDAGLNLVRTSTRSGTDFDIGVTGGGRLDYKLADLEIGLDLSQSVDPSSTGSLQSFTRLGASASHRINSRERLALSLDYTRRVPLGGTSATLQTLGVGPRYTFTLTRETTLSLGYRFRAQQGSTTGDATGHRLFLEISRDLAFWP